MVWRTVADAAVDIRKGRVTREQLEFADPRWPAHLHIDLLQRARGMGAGRTMVTRWLEELRANSVPGCHIQTMAENTAAVAFFESMGFVRHGDPVLTPGLRTRDGGRMHVQAMVLDPGLAVVPWKRGEDREAPVTSRHRGRPRAGPTAAIASSSAAWSASLVRAYADEKAAMARSNVFDPPR